MSFMSEKAIDEMNKLRELGEIKKKSWENYKKGNMQMDRYYKRKYIDMVDNKGIKGIEHES